MENLRAYLRIKQAAEFLGVSPGTLRNWGRRGKVATRRHPINGYRLYRKADLEAILQRLERSSRQQARGDRRPRHR